MKWKHIPDPRLMVAAGSSNPVTAYHILVFTHQYAASANPQSETSYAPSSWASAMTSG
ncbi:MAG: hypothetical protein ACXV5D_10030 [Halobacteriota archaeon]